MKIETVSGCSILVALNRDVTATDDALRTKLQEGKLLGSFVSWIL